MPLPIRWEPDGPDQLHTRRSSSANGVLAKLGRQPVTWTTLLAWSGAVGHALAAHDAGSATCASERWRLEQGEARVEAQLAELRRTRRNIRDA